MTKRLVPGAFIVGLTASICTGLPGDSQRRAQLLDQPRLRGHRVRARTLGEGPALRPGARGLHSFTFQLNLSAFCGIGGVFEGCLRGVLGVWGSIRGVLGVFSCQKRLKLS